LDKYSFDEASVYRYLWKGISVYIKFINILIPSLTFRKLKIATTKSKPL